MKTLFYVTARERNKKEEENERKKHSKDVTFKRKVLRGREREMGVREGEGETHERTHYGDT